MLSVANDSMESLENRWVLYLKAVRSEMAGLELGAFVYYRRAVERIWPALLDRFIKLSQYDASLDQLRQLRDARDNKQINRSMDSARESIPATLYVDGKPCFGFDVAHRFCRLPAGARASASASGRDDR